jgi:hypothetical protein
MSRNEATPPKSDTVESPQSERETETKQNQSVTDSKAVQDSDVDADQVEVLPGTGGPDDVGDVEVDPADLNLDAEPDPADKSAHPWTP